jgi:glucose-1-phosphate adenylyltransferase
MGADYYEGSNIKVNKIPIGIGESSQINGAIIDKNARIGANVIINPFPPGTEQDHYSWSIRDGIVVIPKSVIIPEGTVISPS